MIPNAGETPSVTDASLVHQLNTLIEVCHNGHDGYMEVANGINSAAYKTMFAEYALQRRRFASQLVNLINELGGEPDDDGVLDSWANIRQVVMGGDHGAIFEAIERAEDASINMYETTLEYEDLPHQAKAMLNDHLAQFVHAHDRIRSLRDAYRKNHA